MRLPARLRYPLLLGVLLAASIAGACALRYAPLDVYTIDRDARPVTATPQQTYAFARAQLALFGGLPPDAVFQGGGGTFTWLPREPLGTMDRIVVEVNQHQDGGLYAAYIFRRWHSAWWRSLRQWWIRAHAPPIADPRSVSSTCPHGYDVDAIRGVLAASLQYEPNFSWRVERVGTAAIDLVPGARVSWGRSTVTVMARNSYSDDAPLFSMPIRAAWIADARDRAHGGVRWIAALHFSEPRQRWVWSMFVSPDMEPICR